MAQNNVVRAILNFNPTLNKNRCPTNNKICTICYSDDLKKEISFTKIKSTGALYAYLKYTDFNFFLYNLSRIHSQIEADVEDSNDLQKCGPFDNLCNAAQYSLKTP